MGGESRAGADQGRSRESDGEDKVPIYCPLNGLPPEYCEYYPVGARRPRLRPRQAQGRGDGEAGWPASTETQHNANAGLRQDAALDRRALPLPVKGEDEAGDVGKKGKRGGGVIKKKTISADKQKVIISKEVRNKKKAVTSVEGLETFSVKLKDAAKVFGKKFAASSSVKEKDSGGQEIVIQGDVIWDLPALLEKEYKIPKSKIFEREKGGVVEGAVAFFVVTVVWRWRGGRPSKRKTLSAIYSMTKFHRTG